MIIVFAWNKRRFQKSLCMTAEDKNIFFVFSQITIDFKLSSILSMFDLNYRWFMYAQLSEMRFIKEQLDVHTKNYFNDLIALDSSIALFPVHFYFSFLNFLVWQSLRWVTCLSLENSHIYAISAVAQISRLGLHSVSKLCLKAAHFLELLIRRFWIMQFFFLLQDLSQYRTLWTECDTTT